MNICLRPIPNPPPTTINPNRDPSTSSAMVGRISISFFLIYSNFHLQSTLDYGSIIYSLANQNTLKTLNTVQNAGIRMSIGAFKSSPFVRGPLPTIGYQTKVPNYKVRSQKDIYSPNWHNKDNLKTISRTPPESSLYKASRHP
ncbi:hypothetical protein ACI65C_008274 [Semiaphis heraclei]